jgi:hypothetical protein
MGYIALALSVAPGIIILIKYNALALLTFFLAIGLSTWLTLIFTTFIYLLISKTVEGERFKDIITYVQVIMGILIFAGYQLMPRIMDTNVLNNSAMTIHWWTYLVPPFWLAALVRISLFTGITNQILLLSILAVLLPIAGAALLVKFMSKGFENILGEGASEYAAPAKQRDMKRDRLKNIKNLFCMSDTETAGWDLAVATTRRDRKFKQSVYPYFGMMIVFALVLLVPDLKNLSGIPHEMPGYSKFLFLTLAGFAGSIAVSQLPYTDTPEAAWIYKVLPMKEHAHILTGAIKAMIVRYFLPVYLLIALPALLLWGIKTFPLILLGGFGLVLLILLSFLIPNLELPFTQVREMQKKGMNSFLAFFNMILIALLAGLLYLTSLISVWIAYIICAVAASLIFLFFRVVRNKKFSVNI